MNRKEIKQKAKEMVKGNKWNIWKPILVYGLVYGVLSYLITALFGNESVASDALKLILSILVIPVIFGITFYNLNLVRGKEFSLKDMTKFYPCFFRVFLISFLTSIFTFLWSLLFIIPGIIAVFSYSMVYYITVDDESLSELEVIKKSKELMKGHKWEYFVFKLSFIGWELLAILTCGILYIWLLPYITISEVLFYENLIGSMPNEGTVVDDVITEIEK